MNRTRLSSGPSLSASRGFTVIELLVMVGIVVLLLSIFIPYLSKLRESDRRVRCQDNLRKIGWALSSYAKDNNGSFPRVIYDAETKPTGYTCYTGPDDNDPFTGEGVAPNDVTASLWLLVRVGYVPPDYSPVSSIFICPSTSDWSDPMLNANGQAAGVQQRGNFRSGKHLSYSYSSPFSNATGYGMVDFQPAQFAIMADMNPGTQGTGDNVTAPAYGAPPLEMAQANSNNHAKAGQSVLYADMHVEFRKDPYCGVGGDNIYTAVAPSPIFTGVKPDMSVPGVLGPEIGPAWQTDSYLVPTDDEE